MKIRFWRLVCMLVAAALGFAMSGVDSRAGGREERVREVVTALQRIKDASLQMEPCRSALLEPVIAELNDRIGSVRSDDELTRVEHSVATLIKAMRATVEPEISL